MVIIKLAVLLIFFCVGFFVSYGIFKMFREHKGAGKVGILENLWAVYRARIIELNNVIFHLPVKNEKLPLFVLLFVCFIGFLSWIFTNSILLFFVFLILSYVFPKTIVDIYRRRRAAKIEQQLVPSLVLIGNGVKAGLDVIQAFELVVHDMDPPITDEFAQVLKEYNLGTPFEEALISMRQRLGSRTVNTFVTSVIIQRESGGNITSIIGQIIETIRESFKLENKVATLTSQGKMQSRVILALPWGLAFLLFLIQPSFMLPMFTTTIGLILVLCVALLQMVGMVFIKKIVTVEV